MLNMMSGPACFWSGLFCGTIWAVLLWFRLPGRTPRPQWLSQPMGLLGLPVSGGVAWILWWPVFGPLEAFFCLGGWSMLLLCLLPTAWAFRTTRQARGQAL